MQVIFSLSRCRCGKEPCTHILSPLCRQIAFLQAALLGPVGHVCCVLAVVNGPPSRVRPPSTDRGGAPAPFLRPLAHGHVPFQSRSAMGSAAPTAPASPPASTVMASGTARMALMSSGVVSPVSAPRSSPLRWHWLDLSSAAHLSGCACSQCTFDFAVHF